MTEEKWYDKAFVFCASTLGGLVFIIIAVAMIGILKLLWKTI